MADYASGGAEDESDELFSDSEEECSYAVVAGSTASCSATSTVTETLSDIKALLEKVIKKVENNEAAIKELKEQFTRFEMYLIMPNIKIFSRKTMNKKKCNHNNYYNIFIGPQPFMSHQLAVVLLCRQHQNDLSQNQSG